jgi:anion-transporting  ArsA/GET3 family ATPase
MFSKPPTAPQAKVLTEIEAYFAPVKMKRVPLFNHEVLGRERLEEFGYEGLFDRRRGQPSPRPG